MFSFASDVPSALESHLRHINRESPLLLEEHVYEVLPRLHIGVATLANLVDSIELEHLFFNQLICQAGHDIIPVEQNVLHQGLKQLGVLHSELRIYTALHLQSSLSHMIKLCFDVLNTLLYLLIRHFCNLLLFFCCSREGHIFSCFRQLKVIIEQLAVRGGIATTFILLSTFSRLLWFGRLVFLIIVVVGFIKSVIERRVRV